MGKFNFKTIHKQENLGASAFIFDLRNSTKITRFISFDERFMVHVDYMRNLHKFIYSTIYGKFSTGSDKDEFALNDTGDGYICAFWGKNHSIDCMATTIEIRNYLNKTLPEQNRKLKLRGDYKLTYGFAIHTGGVTIERVNFNDRGGRLIHKDFILGILPNSVSRLESLNKLFTEFSFVATGNFKTCFNNHASSIRKTELKNLFNIKKGFVKRSPGRVNINDSKPEGHHVYTLNDNFFKKFSESY